jgi:hypothetical protein
MVRLDPLDEDMEQSPPQTEDAKERGFVKRRDDDRLGKTDSVNPEEDGDIADEGPGHRG